MTQKFISFYDSTGKFLGQSSCEEAILPMIMEETAKIPNQYFIEGDWFQKPYYVLDGVVTPRPENPAILSGLELSNLPTPCTIKIGTQSYQCAESTATLTFNHPGTYNVSVIAWPYLDKEFPIDYSA